VRRRPAPIDSATELFPRSTSQETETPLRKALDAIDRMRMRVLPGGWLAVIVTLAWTTFAVILIVVRMAKKILLAVELSGMGGHLEPKPMTLRA